VAFRVRALRREADRRDERRIAVSTDWEPRHGYSSPIHRERDIVVKDYSARADGTECWHAAVSAMRALNGRFPVPELAGEQTVGTVRMRLIDGNVAEDDVLAGHAATVFEACGHALRDLQSIDPSTLNPALDGDGTVIVHGDFRVDNVMMSRDDRRVLAVYDWDSAHVGRPEEDVAWFEWHVRVWNELFIEHLPAFWSAFGPLPSWESRHTAMIERCEKALGRSLGHPDREEKWRGIIERVEGFGPLA
jgi:aminoglycoside phosphotransferase (APT) family kinase protein